MVRLPLAALLGAALALRPKRRGTPPRQPAVIQTQIILAVVGAVIMLVVGASLARAFGIVGAANLIRYRSKIEDPKDAVVMLCALAVGLASGVGLYALAVFSTVFLVVALWVIESFEPRSASDVRAEGQGGRRHRRAAAEDRARSCSRYSLEFELRTSSDEEVCYEVQVPLEVQTDRVTNADPEARSRGPRAVEWAEKKTSQVTCVPREADHPAGRRPRAAAAGGRKAPRRPSTSSSSGSTGPSSRRRSRRRSPAAWSCAR